MRFFFYLLRYTLLAMAAAFFSAIFAVAGVYLYLAPDLPDIETLRDVRLQVPLRIYTQDGDLISEFGEIRRIPLHYDEFPEPLIAAILAAEDTRFFEHPGVDYQGLLRAAINLAKTGDRTQGGSTITMQVARNFFLTRERTYIRKLNEILLALKIERELVKEEILELYLNKIYLGHRAYGFAAAAQVYYGKPISELGLDQFAMIAGLPKAPSAYNPISNPRRAQLRRDYVLRRMLEVGYIDQGEFEQAINTQDIAQLHIPQAAVNAHYVAEMVRTQLLQQYGEAVYTEGLHVYTTLDSRHQQAANRAVRDHLFDYDRRHGYRGPLGHLEMTAEMDAEAIRQALAPYRNVGELRVALVTGVAEDHVQIQLPDGTPQRIDWEAMSWARAYINVNRLGPAPKQPAEILKVGDVIHARATTEGWQLSQLPNVSGALVSLNPQDGALLALVGGFDFFHSKFNRATQAERQPGSVFKSFIYAAALEHGFTAASVINDAPVVFADRNLESEWRPSNYSGRFYGPTSFRDALANSRNLVSIRIMESIGTGNAVRFMERFGFDTSRLSRDLSLALGSASLTPYELTRGFAVFANGGYLVEPYFIQRIEDEAGNILFEASPTLACETCLAATEDSLFPDSLAESTPGAEQEELLPEISKPFLRQAPRTVDERNIYLMNSIMTDVIRRGTGRRALQLGRTDLAGKTGTTNEQRDAWFAGYNGHVVSTAWVGFDTPQPLGNQETGARAALPIWIDYMRVALEGQPAYHYPRPDGIVSVRIDPQTGQYAAGDSSNAIFELFRSEHAPQPPLHQATPATPADSGSAGSVTEELF